MRKAIKERKKTDISRKENDIIPCMLKKVKGGER